MKGPENIDPTIPVRQEHQFDLAKLQAYLNIQSPELGKIREIRQYPGGFSNLTFSLRTETGTYVLRRPPKGANIQSAHNMEREFRILKTLEPHYKKIPAPVLYCDESEIIGSPFFIMSQVPGLILRGSNPPTQKLDWSKIAHALIRNLADLHQLPLEADTIDQIGKPAGYISRQVQGWCKRYLYAQTDTLEGMDQLSTWLLQHFIEADETSLIHNDYKYDNLVLDPANPEEIRAVLDWEMATVGHPLMDLGTTLAYWAEAEDPKMLYPYNLSWMPGNPDRGELVRQYFEARAMAPRNMEFFYVFGLFKVGVIAQQIYARYKQGNALDKRFEALIHIVRSCGNQGVLALEKGRISQLYS
ncbi:MAG: phosphotransferase family protein [Saprospiraceae bacterium]|nr:phosphotransferase family protein [Saprospiraceae bacterium]